MKAIFLDRDGVINRDPGFGDYVKSWEEFQFLPGAVEAIRLLTENGYEIFVFSNQAGVGKGLYSEKALDDITRNMLKEIEKGGGRIRAVLYCTHIPEGDCDCRKPKIGLIRKATKGLDIDFKNTYFIGDSRRDIEAGDTMGCKTILLLTGKEDLEKVKTWEIKPDFIKNNLKEAVKWVLEEGQR